MADARADEDTKDLTVGRKRRSRRSSAHRRQEMANRPSPIPRASGVSDTTLDAFVVLAKRIESAQGTPEVTRQCLATVYDMGERAAEIARLEAQRLLAEKEAELASAKREIASLHADVRRWKMRYERATGREVDEHPPVDEVRKK